LSRSQDTTPDALLKIAIAAAKAAATHASANRRRRHEVASRSRHDVKLNLDLEAQIAALAVIRTAFPDHATLAEEDTAPRERNTEFQWIVDPIDGTVNFSHGLPQWCSSVAVRRGDRMVAGAVCAPDVDELYTASADGPALLNGKPIRVSPVSRLDEAIVFTGLDKKVDPALKPFFYFERIALNTQKARVMGAAALDICHVACGQGDGYFEAGIYIWDVAAAGLIVERAGGTVQILRHLEGERLVFLASNGILHTGLRQLVDIAA
jgi:myo-inositol-1(or 4)-monophosphatase